MSELELRQDSLLDAMRTVHTAAQHLERRLELGEVSQWLHNEQSSGDHMALRFLTVPAESGPALLAEVAG